MRNMSLKEYIIFLQACSPKYLFLKVEDFPELEEYEKEILTLRPNATTFQTGVPEIESHGDTNGNKQVISFSTIIHEHGYWMTDLCFEGMGFSYYPASRIFNFGVDGGNVSRMIVFINELKKLGKLTLV